MLRFRIKTEINKPVEEVFSMFIDRHLMAQWQPGLVSDEKQEGKDGLEKFKLVYKTGKRNLIMTETVLKSSFPDHVVMYDLKGIRNTANNHFEAKSKDSTLWIYETEFRFKGLMKLIGPFMKKGLEKQSKIIASNFKAYAEWR